MSSPPDPYQIALRLLSYRWRSEKELREKLSGRGVGEGEIETTIRRLTDEGWVDDERFAREYVRSRSRRHGRRRIRADLRRFGITDESASTALGEELSRDAEDEILRTAARRKMETLVVRHGNDSVASEVGRRKLARFLLNRGYPESAVRKVVYELTGDLRDGSGSEERDE